ncbi:major facilitator superfamily domain-containing protein [Baffinella frigidus]|nr:major facilitator superfamily domain-containing protein [Cryptophyta sp. CCMP2293]|mmetsp:Transcript_60771/g.144638  ORF Transcript_60771/g.144638 Transcript_60771/m.144638 type:complete len:492 (+) Transcript_60771:168-1643(+)
MEQPSSRLNGNTANLGAPSVEDQINAIGLGRFQYLLILIFGLIVVSDGMNMVVISILYTTLHDEWGLTQLQEGMLAGVVFGGFILGTMVGGFLGDVWGRRNTLLFSGVLFVASAAASSFAPDLIWLMVLRTLVGFAVGFKLPVSVSIMVELTPAKDRGVLGIALAGIAFAVGEMFVCAAGIAIHAVDPSPDWWRSLLLACVIPDVFGIPLAWRYVPESPHFMISQGRIDEVEELIAEVAVMNTGSTECLLQGGKVRQRVEAAPTDWSVGDLFSPALAQITFFVTSVWVVCSFCYYGHVFSYPLALEERYHMEIESQYAAVFWAAAAEIPGLMIAMTLIDRDGVGRRKTLLFFFLAASAVALVVPFLLDSTAFLIGNMVLKGLINTPFCVMYIFAAELFPTTHRATGIAFTSSASRVAGGLSPIITAWSISQSIMLTYQLFAIAMAIGAMTCIAYDFETSKQQLSDFAGDALSNVSKHPERTPLLRKVKDEA